MNKPYFEKVTILGVGLIGGSFALALREQHLCGEISGFGRSRDNLAKAKERGIIDSFETDPASACKNSDLVLFATPVGSFLDLGKMVAKSLKQGALVTDAGSVKGNLVYEMEKIIPHGVNYIGGHPISGSDRSGIDSSRAQLFKNAKCIITPTGDSDAVAMETVSDLWKTIGAMIIIMSPERHDRIYASVSHLPHLIAYSMVNSVAGIDPSFLEFGGQGFADMTRIASSSQELWRDICMLNRENLIEMIAVFQKNLDSLSQYLRASDSDSLEREFRNARTLRENLGQD